MPGAGAPSPVSVPERITGVKLKESLRAIEERDLETCWIVDVYYI